MVDLFEKLLETKRIRKVNRNKKYNTTITLSLNSIPLWDDLEDTLRKSVPGMPKRMLSLFVETMIRQCHPIIKKILKDDKELSF